MIPINLIMVGNSEVGKSSLALRYVVGTFNENVSFTCGAARLHKQVGNYSVNIWDTAG